MGKIGRLSNHYFQEIRWFFIQLRWVFTAMPKSSLSASSSSEFTIGITTYKERYESYLKPLVKKMVYLFPDTPIVIAANGHHNQSGQKEYLQQITKWISSYRNIILITYEQPQGLCKLWNQIVLKSTTQNVFLFNEDINISKSFKAGILSSRILNSELGLINGSYSHFMLNKSIIKEVGWFDERFSGIGYEDHDYEIRMMIANKEMKHFKISGIKNECVVPKDWSYGGDHDVVHTKYSSPNEKYYFSKWKFSDTEVEGFVYVRIAQGYVKQIEGMETPNFYPEIKLS